MHHDEFIALCESYSLQKDCLWAASLASGSPISKTVMSTVIFLA